MDGIRKASVNDLTSPFSWVRMSTPLEILTAIRDGAPHLAASWRALESSLSSLDIPTVSTYIDDGSVDGTSAVLADLARMHESVRWCSGGATRGKGPALLTGIRRSSAEAILFLDDDKIPDPEMLREMLARLDDGLDLVNGWRKERRFPGRIRKSATVLLHRQVNRKAVCQLQDPTSPVKLVRRSVFDDIGRSGPLSHFPLEYAALVARTAAEVPLRYSWTFQAPTRYTTVALAKEFAHLELALALFRLPGIGMRSQA